MADIASLLANAGQTNADFDLGKLNRSFWEGKDQTFKNDERELFKGGVPKNPDGSINYGAMRDALFQHGNVASGTAVRKSATAWVRLKMAARLPANRRSRHRQAAQLPRRPMPLRVAVLSQLEHQQALMA